MPCTTAYSPAKLAGTALRVSPLRRTDTVSQHGGDGGNVHATEMSEEARKAPSCLKYPHPEASTGHAALSSLVLISQPVPGPEFSL